MGSFAPLNFYAFAAARGEFLRPDVQALLKAAPVGPFSNFANPHDIGLQREAEAVLKALDALLFPDGVPNLNETPASEVPFMQAPALFPLAAG